MFAGHLGQHSVAVQGGHRRPSPGRHAIPARARRRHRARRPPDRSWSQRDARISARRQSRSARTAVGRLVRYRRYRRDRRSRVHYHSRACQALCQDWRRDGIPDRRGNDAGTGVPRTCPRGSRGSRSPERRATGRGLDQVRSRTQAAERGAEAAGRPGTDDPPQSSSMWRNFRFSARARPTTYRSPASPGMKSSGDGASSR